MHKSRTLDVGMDVHKEAIAVAYVAKAQGHTWRLSPVST